MQRRAQEVTLGANRLKRRAALAIHQAVTTATPVRTGRARANWLVALGGPASAVVGTPGKKPTDAPDPIGPGAATIGQSAPEQPIHITNNLPYIKRLNEGHSAQAPANYVQDAINAGIAAVSDEKVFE